MFPLYKDKHKLAPLFTSQMFVEYEKKHGNYQKEIPENIAIYYQKSLTQFLKDNYQTQSDHGVITITHNDKKVGFIGGRGFGAPAASALLEELIAQGAKKFISFGFAGTLQRSIDIGDFVVCDKALRDEGTSYHYLPAEKFSFASSELTTLLESVLKENDQKYHIGPSWTTDAPYQETFEEIKAYQEEEILTVEMEASALFAVSRVRNVQMASIFTISDSLADLKWDPQFHFSKDRLHQMVDVIIKTLAI